MNPKYVFYALILVAVALEIVADVLFKKWALEHRTLLLSAGLAIYFIGTVFWAYSLKYEQLSSAIVVFTILNLIVISIVGVLYFGERLTLWNKIGIGLGVLSVILVEL